MLAWENIRHFATPPLVSPRNDVWETSGEIPYWWRVTIQIWVVLLIGWSKFPMRFGQSEATSSVWNFCAHFSDVIHRQPVVVSQSVSCFLRLLNWHAGYPYLGTASNNWRGYMQRGPLQKEISCWMKPFNWGVGGVIANRASWQAKLKVIFFFGSKLPDFWMYMYNTVHVTFKSFRQYTLSQPFFLIFVPCAGKIWREKLSLRTFVE